MLRRFLSTRLVALSLLFSVGAAMVPARSDAFLILAPYPIESGAFAAELLLCIVFLPFCIFDQKGGNVSSVTGQDLIDNGYTADQVAEIKKDQDTVLSYMKDHNITSAAELPIVLEALKGQISQDYVDFVQSNPQ